MPSRSQKNSLATKNESLENAAHSSSWAVSEAGLSDFFGGYLEINVFNSEYKVCSFNCSYCSFGATKIRLNQVKKDSPFFSTESLSEALEKKLESVINRTKNRTKIDSLLLSGSGEPTMSPWFGAHVDSIRKLRDRLLPHAKLRVLTNGAHLSEKQVQSGLKSCDEVIVKLDAGDEGLFKTVNDPLVRISVSQLTSQLRNFGRHSLQSIFFEGQDSNCSQEAIESWIECVGIAKPEMVYLKTIDSNTLLLMPNPLLTPTSEEMLYSIGSRMKRRTHIDFKVAYP